MKFSKKIEIDGREIGHEFPTYVIAEAGVSHFGSEEKAYALVDLAAESHADAVKFQIFDAQALVSNASPEWKERLGERQLEYEVFGRIQSYCQSKKITFMATAHDDPSLDFLESLQVPAYKIGSGEVGNWPFIERIAKLDRPVILSTGMYDLKKVNEAVDIFLKANNPDLSILHCSTRYPTPPSEVNLRAMEALKKKLNIIIGYSDHTAGYHIPLAAVALGAAIIEKHISLDFNVPNAQDWKVSCGPSNLSNFIRELREIEAALGSSKKQPSAFENDQVWARKSLVAAKSINVGTVLDSAHVISKRPGTGISPDQLDRIIGKTASRKIDKDALLSWEDLQ